MVFAFVTNFILGQFNPGFEGQPVFHTMQVWNFAGMVLAGLAFALAGGCPGRQLFLSGEGDGDAAVFVLGMIMEAVKSGNENEVIVMVDTDASKENVSRAAQSKNYSVTDIQQQGDEYRMTLIK